MTKPRFETAAAFAAHFGITAKALRVYEREGLMRPGRSGKDWRLYGPEDTERLTAILALKRLGLPLARIRALLQNEADLAPALALQQEALERSQHELHDALALVRAARAALARGERLSPDDLAALVRRLPMQKMTWTPELEAIAENAYTPEQRAALAARKPPQAELDRVQAAWAKVFADIERLGPAAATSEEGLALGRTAHALIQEFTQGDKGLWNSAGRFWQGVGQDPAATAQTGFDQARWAFLGAAFAALKANGEISA